MAAHAAWLLDVGNGTHHRSEGLPADVIGIPDNMAAPTEDVNDLIDTIFPDLAARMHDTTYIRGRAILTPKNVDVDDINNRMLDSLPKEVRQPAKP